MSSREYFVLDGDGHVSFNIRDEATEAFATLTAAKRRAREMAKSEPGHTIVITQSVAFVTCEIAPPQIEMRERTLRNGGKKK